MLTRTSLISTISVVVLSVGIAGAQPRGDQRPGAPPDAQQQRQTMVAEYSNFDDTGMAFAEVLRTWTKTTWQPADRRLHY